MGSSVTGELFTQSEYEAMTKERRQELGIVSLTNEESNMLKSMPLMQRRKWIIKNKKEQLRKKHKIERQRRKARRK